MGRVAAGPVTGRGDSVGIVRRVAARGKREHGSGQEGEEPAPAVADDRHHGALGGALRFLPKMRSRNPMLLPAFLTTRGPGLGSRLSAAPGCG
jgi:hypothetical protein